MNFIIYTIVDKKTNRIKYHGFFFSRIISRADTEDKDISGRIQWSLLRQNGFSPEHHRVSFGHFKGLRKLCKAYFKTLWGI